MIACIGEKLDEREGGITEKVVFAQTKVIAGKQLTGFYANMSSNVVTDILVHACASKSVVDIRTLVKYKSYHTSLSQTM